jgi:hypothetical protein
MWGELTERDAVLRGRLLDARRRSPFQRARMDRAGLVDVHEANALQRLPSMALDDTPSMGALLGRMPTKRKPSRAERRRYRPVWWSTSADVPLAYSVEDLETLGRAGQASLDIGGIRSHDVVVSLVPQRMSREREQLASGARRSGIAVWELEPSTHHETVDLLSPAVLAGEAFDVVRVVETAKQSRSDLTKRLHTVLLVGDEPTYRQRKFLADNLRPEAALVRWWAPDGVMAAWPQCRGGSAFHVFAAVDHVEIVDPLTGLPVPSEVTGEIVWTGAGWWATAMLRLRTRVGGLVPADPCLSCGSTSLRIEAVEQAPLGFPSVLDGQEMVTAWFAELQHNGDRDELVIWLALVDQHASISVVQQIDRCVGPARVVIASEEEIERKIADAKGERFGDRRAMTDDDH